MKYLHAKQRRIDREWYFNPLIEKSVHSLCIFGSGMNGRERIGSPGTNYFSFERRELLDTLLEFSTLFCFYQQTIGLHAAFTETIWEAPRLSFKILYNLYF